MIKVGNKKYYFSEEVAEMLGVTPHTVWRHIKAGRLGAKKVGKRYIISEDAIISFLEGWPSFSGPFSMEDLKGEEGNEQEKEE